MIEINDKTFGIEAISDSVELEHAARLEIRESVLDFGIPYLDDVLGGILKHDLVLIGAATAGGKSELITKIARSNALKGKKVYVFALEAEPYEITRRIRFTELAQNYKAGGGTESLNYFHWYLGYYDELLYKYEPVVLDKLMQLKNLKCFYKTDVFDVAKFTELFTWAQRDADLIICDHIHYFDFDSENENKALGDATKKIRDLVLLHGIPTVLVGHVRKKSGNDRSIVPSGADFHGSSNLIKIATKAITIGTGGPNAANTNQFITYFRTAKFRMFGAVMAYIGITLFDTTTNEYLPDFKLGTLNYDETKVIDLPRELYPKWLRRRKV